MRDNIDYKKILIEYILIIKNRESISFLEYYDDDKTIEGLSEEETNCLRLAAEEAEKRY